MSKITLNTKYSIFINKIKGSRVMDKKEKVEEITPEEQSFIDEMHAQRIEGIDDETWVKLYHNKKFYGVYERTNATLAQFLRGKVDVFTKTIRTADDWYNFSMSDYAIEEREVDLLDKISDILKLNDENIAGAKFFEKKYYYDDYTIGEHRKYLLPRSENVIKSLAHIRE